MSQKRKDGRSRGGRERERVGESRGGEENGKAGGGGDKEVLRKGIGRVWIESNGETGQRARNGRCWISKS